MKMQPRMPTAHSQPQAAWDNLIVGLGQTGLSVARYLARRGESFAVADSRAQPPALERLRAKWPDCELRLGGFDSALFRRARRLIVSPGVALSTPAIAEAQAAGVEVVGDIELFARENRAPVLAITGSNGKSTVTALVGEMARAAGLKTVVGGNLGPPALDLLDGVRPDLAVLELSSFQLESCESLAPRAAVILNISPDHLDRYPSLEAYAAAKGRIYARAECCVINREDALASSFAPPGRCVGFGLDAPATDADYGLLRRDDGVWLARGDRALLPATALRLAGRHNLANALAALALGEAGGLPLAAMLDTLRRFRGLPHRCQWIGRRRGVDWYDDSKGTNVGATAAAVEGLGGPLILIAGGLGKGQDFSPLREVLRRRARAVILIGEAAAELRRTLAGVAPLVTADDMPDAVRRADDLARPGDKVLLSPACASFDMFRDYAARGEAFVQAFEGLPA